LAPAFQRATIERARRVRAVEQLMQALSYKGVLARGFALVRNAAGEPLHMAAGIAAGDVLDIQFSDGHVSAVAGTDTPPSGPPPVAKPTVRPVKRGGKPLPDEDAQPTLFGS
ncbi:MAG TPA: exodeoxyribonuclease VII large subunit, partial [Ancylobacter sp.]